jgi:ribonuclease P protein component
MYTFSKKERLNSKISIHRLFEHGSSFFSYPFKVYYTIQTAEEAKPTSSVLFSIGKKQFKLAVDRNRVKRLCRETYRLNKSVLIEALEKKQVRVEVAFIYVGKTLPDFHDLEVKMQKALLQLATIEKN